MDDSNHKEGDRYIYQCEKCGYNRGILEYSTYSTSCPECHTWYTRTKIPKEGDRRIKPLEPHNPFVGGMESNEEDPAIQTFKDGEWV